MSEEVHRFDKRLVPFKVKGMSFCKDLPCSWDPDKPFSWKTNREQNATQVFYFVNRFHDHLLAKPIGFTEAAGNFENTNSTKHGQGPRRGRDPDDGRRLHGQRPPRRQPRRQRQHEHPARRHAADHADVPAAPARHVVPRRRPVPGQQHRRRGLTVYHEYTHGLSNRLVVDVMGNSTLGPIQGDAMGEAWGDWYAADSLVSDGLEVDKKGKADLDLFKYDGAGAPLIRTQDIDCTPSSPASRCPRTPLDDGPHRRLHLRRLRQGHRAPRGARRRRDLGPDPLVAARQGRLPRRPEPGHPGHGALAVQPVVPRHAQRAARGGHRPLQGQVPRKIWNTFASRGMGFYAGSLGGDDAPPAADTKTPPNKVKKGVLTGTVEDSPPVSRSAASPSPSPSRARVWPTRPRSPPPTARTPSVRCPTGHYGKLTVNGAGYVPDLAGRHGRRRAAPGLDFSVRPRLGRRERRRDGRGLQRTRLQRLRLWARRRPSTSRLATGWGSTTGNNKGTPTNVFVPKHLTVDLKRKVNITSFAVDPSATCGDAGSASTGAVPDRDLAGQRHLDRRRLAARSTAADRGRLNTVTPTTGSLGVQYVRFTILGNQVPDFATNCPNGAFDGCTYTDLTELEVYGVATPVSANIRRPVAHQGRPPSACLRGRRRSARAARPRGRRRACPARRGQRHPRRTAAAGARPCAPRT